ncbi:hypothetical protein ACOMHN_002619 [Nucella lapillus]
MSEHCGGLVDMKDEVLSTVRLRLTSQAVYRPLMSCTVVLRAPPQHRLTVVVEWLDIAAGRFSGACTDYLSAWNGEIGNRTTHVEGLDVTMCGQETPPSVMSEGRSVTLHFDSNTIEDGAGFSLLFTSFHHGFSLLYTPFHHGECSGDEFRCDNDRCIDQRLKCDGDDNCGDGSDACLLSITTAALVLIVVTLIGCLAAVVALLYCHREKIFGRKSAEYQPTTESTTASTIADNAAA